MTTPILITGIKNSGKDTVASFLEKHLKARNFSVGRASFAFPLKRVVARMIFGNTSRETMEKIEFFKNRDEPLFVYGKKYTTMRKVLQYVGDNLREEIDEDIFVKKTKAIVEESKSDFFIIPDLRFTNELEHFIDGIIIRVDRDEVKTDDDHKSETEVALMDDDCFEYIIDNNGTLEELEAQVEKIVFELILF